MDDHRTTDAEGGTRTTIIERRGGGGTILLAIVLLFAVAVGAFYLFTMAPQRNARDKAITGAADSVSRTADKIGDAVDQNK
ncbi:MAG: hypothetical protein ACTHOJ_10655 [Sphingomonas oligoaromativorans]|jgi:hypothetical protein|uniref:hypothetical protein n=1 Tax=Sphingomonas oligoaromativorans TaxID=575322 RepID=UPI001423090F|nr:hypothetical protein [Sphingomonas oligoaromativorans]NIJ31698.1 hypothetical protein [Sphingomonas oligoaromativorans]